jgi:hypothetical protein
LFFLREAMRPRPIARSHWQGEEKIGETRLAPGLAPGAVWNARGGEPRIARPRMA